MEAFRLTLIPWYNSAPGSDGKSAKILAMHGYSYIAGDFACGTDYTASGRYGRKPPHPEHGQIQVGIACARSTATIVIDVDNAQLFAGTHAADWVIAHGEHLPAQVFSVRDDASGNARIVIDARAWADNPETWPQHSTGTAGRGYDLLTAGLCAMGTHYSGASYPWPADPVASVLLADDALRIALEADGVTFGVPDGIRTSDYVLTDATDADRAHGQTYIASYGNGTVGPDYNAALGFVISSLSYGLSREEIEPELYRVLQCEAGHGGGSSCSCWTDTEIDSLFTGQSIKGKPAEERARRNEDDQWLASIAGRDDWEAWAAEKDAEAESHIRPPGVPAWVTPAQLAAQDNGHAPADGLFTWIGLAPFDPPYFADQLLANEALYRMYPALRFTTDSLQWIKRAAERWEEHGDDLAGWATAQLAWIMPFGNPDADKDPDGKKKPESEMTSADYTALDQYKRRQMFLGSAKASGIERKMRKLVAAEHPCSVKLANLDADPKILWAGGIPFDLDTSQERLTVAELPPDIVHLHTAAYLPDERPTPLWDAFTAAVWPDPEERAWALRVLSVSFTGYPGKTLPILYGGTNTGKSETMNLLMDVLGSYAHAADPRILVAADRAHASIIIALKGRRLSFIDEAPRSNYGAQERLKQLTGGSALTGNAMGKNPVTFLPTHTLILTANPESEPQLTDDAVKDRVRLLHCNGDVLQIRDARAAIGGMNGRRWKNEAPGVLAAMMREAARWLADPASARNEQAPLALQVLRDETVAAQDVVLDWVQDCTEPWEPGTSASLLHEEFTAWCKRNDLRGPGKTGWGRKMVALGYLSFQRTTGNRERYYQLKIRYRYASAGTDYAPPSVSYAVPPAAPSVPSAVPGVPVSRPSLPGTDPSGPGTDPSRPSVPAQNPRSGPVSPSLRTDEQIYSTVLYRREEVNKVKRENISATIENRPSVRSTRSDETLTLLGDGIAKTPDSSVTSVPPARCQLTHAPGWRCPGCGRVGDAS